MEITELTRRDIFSIFENGCVEQIPFGSDRKYFYPYYGRLNEIDFLNRIYSLENMVTTDDRYNNAEEDIWQHTISNDDWDFGWVFHDSRFDLMDGPDSLLLKFLCEVFHPACRDESAPWFLIFNEINRCLKNDGFELYEIQKLSGRSIYGWRRLTADEVISEDLVPFSIRHKSVKENKIHNSISKKIRREILKVMEIKNDSVERTGVTGGYYEISIKDAVFEDLRNFYIPKSFDNSRSYIETTDFSSFIMSNYPNNVFDAVELFGKYSDESFTLKINSIFENNNFPFRLLGGKIEKLGYKVVAPVSVPEKGLKELVDEAIIKNNSPKLSDKKDAVEKIWDALERLKSYYVSMDKKSSVEKIISDLSNRDTNYSQLFNEEFIKLTKIGNNFRIRHHETNKIEISDPNYLDYFFLRCYALVNLSIKYLEA